MRDHGRLFQSMLCYPWLCYLCSRYLHWSHLCIAWNQCVLSLIVLSLFSLSALEPSLHCLTDRLFDLLIHWSSDWYIWEETYCLNPDKTSIMISNCYLPLTTDTHIHKYTCMYVYGHILEISYSVALCNYVSYNMHWWCQSRVPSSKQQQDIKSTFENRPETC